jgi:hypothetical protein
MVLASSARKDEFAWYGSGTYLDKVEFLSGPVLSDLEQGCEVNQSGQGQPPLLYVQAPKPRAISAEFSPGP